MGLFPLRWLTRRSRDELISTYLAEKARTDGQVVESRRKARHSARTWLPLSPRLARSSAATQSSIASANTARPIVGQGDEPHTAVDRVRPAYDQAAPFERLQIGCGRRRVHGEPLGKIAHGDRGRLMQREQHRELSVGEAERTKDAVGMPGHHSPCRLDVHAQAGLGDLIGGFELKASARCSCTIIDTTYRLTEVATRVLLI